MTPLPTTASSRWQHLGLLGALIGMGAIIVLTRSALWIPAGSDFVDPAAWTADRDLATAVAAFVRFCAVLLFAYAAVVIILTVVTRRRPDGLLGRLATALGGNVVRAALGSTVLGSTLAMTASAPAQAESGRSVDAPETAVMDRPETATMTLTSPPVADPAPTADPEPTPHDAWIVEPGDHLWHIAEETLSDRTGDLPTRADVHAYWKRLIEANRSVLIDPANPDLILPGQQFLLP